jgi:hypothetical protein
MSQKRKRPAHMQHSAALSARATSLRGNKTHGNSTHEETPCAEHRRKAITRVRNDPQRAPTSPDRPANSAKFSFDKVSILQKQMGSCGIVWDRISPWQSTSLKSGQRGAKKRRSIYTLARLAPRFTIKQTQITNTCLK